MHVLIIKKLLQYTRKFAIEIIIFCSPHIHFFSSFSSLPKAKNIWTFCRGQTKNSIFWSAYVYAWVNCIFYNSDTLKIFESLNLIKTFMLFVQII